MSAMRSIAQSVADFLEYLAVERRCSPRTIEAYGSDLRGLQAHAEASGVVDLLAIDTRLLRAWLASDPGRSPAYRQRMVAAARSFGRWAERRGLIDRNPAEALASPKVVRPLAMVLSVEEATRVVEAPDVSTNEGVRDRAILELLYSTGARVAEVSGLDLGDVSLTEGTARVLGKGGKERLTVLGRPCVTSLEAWLSVRTRLVRDGDGDGRKPLFVGLSSAHLANATRLSARRLGKRGVQLLVARYGRAAGIEGLHPHVFRHSFGTHMLDGGADLRTIQAAMGHERISTSERYLHVSAESVAKAYAAAHPLAKGRAS